MLLLPDSTAFADLSDFFGSGTSSFALVAGLTMIMMTLTVRRMRSRRAAPVESAREEYQRLTAEEHRSQIDEAMARLNELARHWTAQLDTRLARLEALIRDADLRIDALSRGAAHPAGQRLDVTLGDEPPSESSTIAQTRQRVYELADAGKAGMEIAQMLERPLAEVELLLAVRRARQQRAAVEAAAT